MVFGPGLSRCSSTSIVGPTGFPPSLEYILFATKRALPRALRKAIENLDYTITKAKLEIRDENNKMWNSLGRGLANSSPKNNSFVWMQRCIMPNSMNSVDRIIDYVQEKGYKPLNKYNNDNAPFQSKLYGESSYIRLADHCFSSFCKTTIMEGTQ
jgi:hypothetical protein